MRLEFTHEACGAPTVTVTLSRRNLRTLLTKLNEPDSKRTIALDRIPETGYVLVVKAEDDDVHYGNEDRILAGCLDKPGPVSDRTTSVMDLIEESEGLIGNRLPPYSEGEQ